MKTAIVTDSNSGIFETEGIRLGVHVLPMPVLIDNQVYFEGQNLSSKQFYQYLQEGKDVTTSQPSPGDLTALWERVLEAGYDELVYIPMSSGLSSSCATAKMLAEDYEGTVFVVDNHRISVTQRYSALDALALTRAGCTGREIQQELERTGLDSIIHIGVETLQYLKRGGRITPAAAAMGTVMGIKPLLMIQGDNPLLLQYANTRIEELDAERQKQLRLVADLTANSVSASQIDSITGYLDDWESVSFDDKCKVVDILISQIDATSESVTIHWKI